MQQQTDQNCWFSFRLSFRAFNDLLNKCIFKPLIKLINKIEFYTRLNQLFHKVGLDVRRSPTANFRSLLKYLRDNNVDSCFDVGANIGQYAGQIRSSGFTGTIYSIEPQSKAFEVLTKKAAGSSRWKTFNFGLGNSDGKSIINVSKNSVSSSILEINKLSIDIAPETQYVSKE